MTICYWLTKEDALLWSPHDILSFPSLFDVLALDFWSLWDFLQLLRGWKLLLRVLLPRSSLKGTEVPGHFLCWGLLQWEVHAKAEPFQSLVFAQVMPCIHQVLCTDLCSSSDLLISHFRMDIYTWTMHILLRSGMCSCNQVSPLVCMQQKGYSPKFQHHRWGFSGERERKTYSDSHHHFPWSLWNTWIFTCLFSDLLVLNVNICYSHLILSLSLDCKRLWVISSCGNPTSTFYISWAESLGNKQNQVTVVFHLCMGL